ncbi:aminotransferase class III-fold pyridoxal phosphate-dependent enzyme, partial [Pantoea sp. CTOTU49201]
AQVMGVGTHGTTYGGNPLAGAVAGKVMELINQPAFMAGVTERHQWFVTALQELNQRLPVFKEVRGLGLLIGAVLNDDFAGKAKQFNLTAAEEGVMVLIAGANVVRFAPALNISEREVKEGLARFERACERVLKGATS